MSFIHGLSSCQDSLPPLFSDTQTGLLGRHQNLFRLFSTCVLFLLVNITVTSRAYTSHLIIHYLSLTLPTFRDDFVDKKVLVSKTTGHFYRLFLTAEY